MDHGNRRLRRGYHGPMIRAAFPSPPWTAAGPGWRWGAGALAVVLGAGLGAASGVAQDVPAPTRPAAGELVDRVVGIVGDSAIFHSDLLEHVIRLQANGVQVPQDSAELHTFRGQALNELVAHSLVVQAAARDTLISVPDERVDEELQTTWDEQVRRLGSEEQLRQALAGAGMTPAQYRADLRRQIFEAQLSQRYMQSQRGTSRLPPIEESELRESFERDRTTFGRRPATISIRQVILLPQPSDSTREAARAEAERILGLLREGDDLEELARRFSDDPGSAQAGGDLGWVRQGDTVVEFELAVFGLGRGQVSGVVETEYGAHIIRLDRIQGAQRSVSHILIGAEPGPTEVAATRARANEVRAAVAAGTPITEFESEGEGTGLPEELELAVTQLGQLPGGYATELRGARAGDVLGPIEFQSGAGLAFAVVEVTGAREEGEYAYEDLRDQIRTYLEDEGFRERLLERLRAETYVEIRW